MSPPPVRIRIGGSIDSSLGTALRTAAQMTGQAEKAIQRQKKETTRAAETEAKKQLRAQEQLAKAADSLDRQRSRGLFQQYQAQQTAAERAAKAQERAATRAHAAERREIEKTARAAAKAIDAERRERDRTARRAFNRDVRQGESFARRTSHRASRFLMPEAPIGSMVMRGLSGVAQGAGIDWSVQGMVGRNVAIEKLATDISNSGYQAGAPGANGERQDPRAMITQARAIGGQLGMDAMDVLEGIDRFKNITGDLATGRALIGDLAKLSAATGTNLDDMAAAAANVSNGLGDIPDKARILDEVMRTIAGQGKLGAVEISDMATQMARVAASASAFSGDRADIIGKMGALTQEARATGGAPSAAEAARSVVGFANTMKKSARIDAFKKEGIDVFTDKSQTKLKDPIELIKESLKATGGDMQAMNKLFMDVIGGRAVAGFTNRYVNAGGGDAGLKAVDDRVGELLKAQVSKKEVDESAARAAATTAAKAKRFQNELDRVTENVMAKLVPALERAAPKIIEFAEVLGNAASWAVDNTGPAIALAVSAAIARAGIESFLRSGIERMLLGATNAAGVGSRAATLGTVAGVVGSTLTVAALAVTTLTVGKALIDTWFASAQKEQKDAVEKDIEATNAQQAVRQALGTGDLQAAKKAQEAQIALKEQAIQQQVDQRPGYWDHVLRKGMGEDFGNDTFRRQDESRERAIETQTKELAASRALLARIAEAIEAQPPPGGGPAPGGRGQQ